MRNYFVNRFPPFEEIFPKLREELLAGRMRQCWGRTGCDLRLGSETFIKNWKNFPNRSDNRNPLEPQKRYRILSVLLEIKPGDIIIVPKVSSSDKDIGKYFTVVECVKPYEFEPLPQGDCGHIIGVKILGTWDYSSANENANAVGRVLKTFSFGKAVNRILNAEIIKVIDNLIATLPPTENDLDSMMKKMLEMQENYLTELLKVFRDLPSDNPTRQDFLKKIHDMLSMLPPDLLKKIIKELFTKNGYRLVEEEPDFVFELFAEDDIMHDFYKLTEQKKIFVHVNTSPKIDASNGDIHIVVDFKGTLDKSAGIIFVDEETFINILSRHRI